MFYGVRMAYVVLIQAEYFIGAHLAAVLDYDVTAMKRK